MNELKNKLTYFIIGFLFCAVLLLIINSWKPSSVGSESAVSISCSSDGNIAYVTDFKGVQKTEDGGKTWKYVIDNK